MEFTYRTENDACSEKRLIRVKTDRAPKSAGGEPSPLRTFVEAFLKALLVAGAGLLASLVLKLIIVGATQLLAQLAK